MARKIQVLIELDTSTNAMNVTAPWNHLGAVVKMLGAAMQMAGDQIAAEKKLRDEAAKAKPDIVIANRVPRA
jgi:hypothetical protein